VVDVDSLEVLEALDRPLAGQMHLVPALRKAASPADEVDGADVADAENPQRARGHSGEC
jgi:hypothetical protein